MRIPASLCGLVGFKPSKQRVPTDGAFPLSYTLDSIGPIGKSVADCAAADAVMAGEDILPLEPIALDGLRFGIAEGLPLDRLDEAVSAAFDAAFDAALDAAPDAAWFASASKQTTGKSAGTASRRAASQNTMRAPESRNTYSMVEGGNLKFTGTATKPARKMP